MIIVRVNTGSGEAYKPMAITSLREIEGIEVTPRSNDFVGSAFRVRKTSGGIDTCPHFQEKNNGATFGRENHSLLEKSRTVGGDRGSIGVLWKVIINKLVKHW